jgi:hypothetical protein
MIAFLLVTAAISALRMQASIDTTAAIRGTAMSSFNGRPIPGVLIAAPEAQRFAVTDEWGRFALAGLPAGRRAIRISYDGRVTQDFLFDLDGARSKRIAVLLDEEAIDLDPLVEEARQANIWRDLAGFYERRQAYRGFAHFYTREEITRMRPTRLSGLLTLEGIVTRCYEDCRPTRVSRGKICQVPVSVDGVAYREMSYDQIDISNVAAVEVYRGVPPADLDHSLLPSAGSSMWMGIGLSAAGQCGLVEIWTR